MSFVRSIEDCYRIAGIEVRAVVASSCACMTLTSELNVHTERANGKEGSNGFGLAAERS